MAITPPDQYETPPSAAELDYVEALGYDRETFRYRDGTFDATSTDLLGRTLAARLTATAERGRRLEAVAYLINAALADGDAPLEAEVYAALEALGVDRDEILEVTE